MTSPLTSPTSGLRFDGRAALVTGAARGIGRGVALRLDQAKGLAGEVRTRVTDLRKRSECLAAVEATVEAYGHLHVVGNIAGVLDMSHVTDVDEDNYRNMFAVNTDAYFFIAQAAIPHLLKTRGNIINIASNSGLMGGAYTVAYCMTKGAVVQMTRALAMEFMKRKIRINAIAPGETDTGIMEGVTFPEEADWDLIMRYSTPRRSATPAQIAGLFAFVASDDGLNIHGAILSSDAGMTAG
jgi:meso-butanediol dehydrogenase/(S,S)-butanediol dehydrogenase/diacetyl reductase